MSFITDRLQDKKIGTEYDLLKETCQIPQRIWLVVVIKKTKKTERSIGWEDRYLCHGKAEASNHLV